MSPEPDGSGDTDLGIPCQGFGVKRNGHEGFDGGCGGPNLPLHFTKRPFQSSHETLPFAGMKHPDLRCTGRHNQTVGAKEAVNKILDAHCSIPHHAVLELNADFSYILPLSADPGHTAAFDPEYKPKKQLGIDGEAVHVVKSPETVFWKESHLATTKKVLNVLDEILVGIKHVRFGNRSEHCIRPGVYHKIMVFKPLHHVSTMGSHKNGILSSRDHLSFCLG